MGKTAPRKTTNEFGKIPKPHHDDRRQGDGGCSVDAGHPGVQVIIYFFVYGHEKPDRDSDDDGQGKSIDKLQEAEIAVPQKLSASVKFTERLDYLPRGSEEMIDRIGFKVVSPGQPLVTKLPDGDSNNHRAGGDHPGRAQPCWKKRSFFGHGFHKTPSSRSRPIDLSTSS